MNTNYSFFNHPVFQPQMTAHPQYSLGMPQPAPSPIHTPQAMPQPTFNVGVPQAQQQGTTQYTPAGYTATPQQQYTPAGYTATPQQQYTPAGYSPNLPQQSSPVNQPPAIHPGGAVGTGVTAYPIQDPVTGQFAPTTVSGVTNTTGQPPAAYGLPMQNPASINPATGLPYTTATTGATGTNQNATQYIPGTNFPMPVGIGSGYNGSSTMQAQTPNNQVNYTGMGGMAASTNNNYMGGINALGAMSAPMMVK